MYLDQFLSLSYDDKRISTDDSGRCNIFIYKHTEMLLLNFFFLYNKRVVCAPHDAVIKWKHFPRNWPFVRGIHRSPENSPHKGQWRGALMLSLICARINGWVNNREAGDLRRHGAHYDVTVMWCLIQYILYYTCDLFAHFFIYSVKFNILWTLLQL